jgi:hypothetical protein
MLGGVGAGTGNRPGYPSSAVLFLPLFAPPPLPEEDIPQKHHKTEADG